MAIRRDEVERIAALARLAIPAGRGDRLAAELTRILGFVEALDRLDLAGIEPVMLAPRAAELREDRANGRRLDREQALAAAPEAEDGFVVVPPIVENLDP
jgi:aspartyl-tRNA(Asn)/glutamyl-tRNA(Gln) amidotransferase subunit C